MKPIPTVVRRRPRQPLRRQAGLSLIELMISITIGLVILIAVALVFVNASSTRTELERISRQIENGRYAIDLLTDDLRLAGFYGELDASQITPTTLPADPCSLDVADWNAAIPVHVQGYDNPLATPGTCAFANVRPGTDILVVRRARACIAGVGACPAAQNGAPYIQVSLCASDVTDRHRLGVQGAAAFSFTKKDCTAPADKRQYYVHAYFISNDNGAGQDIPTLMRLELDRVGGAPGWRTAPLVEGIEEFNLEYGIDQDGDGAPDAYTADPSDFPVGGCVGDCPRDNWTNVVTVRMFVLARNLEATAGYTDTKTYVLGVDKNGADVTFTPADGFRRHVYSGLVRIANVSSRRDRP